MLSPLEQTHTSVLVNRVRLLPPPLCLLALQLDEVLWLLARQVVADQVNTLLRRPAPAARSLAYLASAPEGVRLQLAEILRRLVWYSKLVVCNVYASHSRQCLR